MKFRFPYFVLILTIASCNYFHPNNNNKGQPIARAFDKYLYRSDIEGIGKDAARPEDSIQAVKNYIDSWIRHNVLVHYAEENLPEEQQQLNDQLRDYKESLLIYLYEKELLDEKLDTTVSEREIDQYYNDHKETFQLKQGVTQVKFIMLSLGTIVKLDSVRAWMNHPNDFTFPKLRGFCNQYALKYSISDSVWYNKEQLGSLLPIEKFNFDNAQYNKNYLEVLDSSYAYLVKFGDYRVKGTDAPVSFVKDEIRNLIINKRKLAFIGSIHKNIYEDALEKNNFEIYTDSKK